MRILIATDGMLPIPATVAHIERLYKDGDTVTVMTAVNLPRRLLDQLKALAVSDPASIEEVVDAAGPGHLGLAGGDRVAERLAERQTEWPRDDVLERYNAQVADTCVQPMIDGLAEAGITAGALVRESEYRTAATIMDACRERRADLLVIGSRGRGRFEGRVGSTGSTLFRHAPSDVLLIRVPG